MWRYFLAILLIAIAPSNSASADALVFGAASFDDATDLWSYSYIVDNQDGVGTISDWGILVNPYVPPPITFLMDHYIASANVPAGWYGPVPTQSTVSCTGGPLCGHFFEEWCFDFLGCNGISVGTTLAGFSFAVPFAPTLDYYFTYVGLLDRFQTGLVIGPDAQSPTFAPLPAALPLFASGLAGLGWLSRRRRKQPQAA